MLTVSYVVAAVSLLAAALAWRRARRASGEVAALRAAARESSAASQRASALLRDVVETTPVALVMFSDSGAITFTNATARDLFFDSADVAGQNFLTMVERASEPLRQALLSGGDELFTVEIDGSPETFHLAKRNLGDGQTLVTVRPMTQEVARQEVATLKKVIGIIGHEVTNSMTPILSLMTSARLVLKRPDELWRLENVFDTVRERAAHLETFLGGYAKVARLAAPACTPVDWAAFFHPLRGLWPGVRIDPLPEETAFLDPAQIQQVLINLVKNAVEAGGPESEIAVRVQRVPEGAVRVSVLDRGNGMTDEAFKKVSVPFFTTKPNGSGIGLAVCREIVQNHRGRFRLARREGGGMAVSFWLPDRGTTTAPANLQARLSLTRT
ncbi:MAG: sensor histidine kinase [Polyangia bacterium]